MGNDEDTGENQPQALGQLTTWTRKSMSPDQNMSIELVQKLMDHSGQTMNMADDTQESARSRIRKKALILARMNKVYTTLRKENDLIVQLKGVCPGHRLSPGVLLEGKERIKSELDLFGHTEAADRANEKRPGAADRANEKRPGAA